MTVRQYVCSAAMARQADARSIQDLGIPSIVLMENAAQAICRKLLEKKPEPGTRITIVCGPGNNGADGMACGRILALHGMHVVVCVDESTLSKDGTIQYGILQNLIQERKVSLEIRPIDADNPLDDALLQDSDLLVDALFGNGLSRDITGRYAACIEAMNKSGTPIVSVDVPSGIDATTGEVLGTAIQAEKTYALDCMKWGLLLGQGRHHAGKVSVLDIGIPSYLHTGDDSTLLMNETDAIAFLPVRSPFANKGTFGKALLCGGSLRMQGALCMAAKACFASGCGTITLYSPKDAAAAIASKINLAMIIPADQDPDGFFGIFAGEKLKEQIEPFTLLSCGNGMGRSEGALHVLETVLASDKPCVIDADGINLLADHPELLNRQAPVILTPHMKEFSRLVNADLDEVLHGPEPFGEKLIAQYPNLTLVIKSDFTLVMDAKRKMVINHPDPALSKGGSGDVLCGIISGLACTGLAPFEAAALGAWIHNRAGAMHESTWSFTPEELINHLPDVFAQLQKQ